MIAVLRICVVDEKGHGQMLRVAHLLLRVFAVSCRSYKTRALCLNQVHRPPRATGCAHQLVQHARQHDVHARLGTDMVGNVQELLNGVGHAVHDLAERPHLAHG